MQQRGMWLFGRNGYTICQLLLYRCWPFFHHTLRSSNRPLAGKPRIEISLTPCL